MLLGAVVDVALEPPPLLVLGLDQPLARGAQLGGPRGQLDQALASSARSRALRSTSPA